MKPTAFVLHPDCARHDTGWRHPEHQGRLPAIARAVHHDLPMLLDAVVQVEAAPATVEDLLRVHSPGHVQSVRRAAELAEESGEPHPLDDDTVVSGASWEAALAAAGCAVTAAELVLRGEAATAFAVSRPPGHHATPDRAMGFCLFNNVAVAVRRIQATGQVRRCLIIDWDVHHGNGTQEIFDEDPDVFFLSCHLSPHYPGTGAETERGVGAGLGTTRNIELPAGLPAEEYHARFMEGLQATLSGFEPDFVFISAGFDCLAGDPLGGLTLEPRDLHRLTTEILEHTRESAEGRVVAVLEGGYVPDRVGAGVVNVLRALAGLPPD